MITLGLATIFPKAGWNPGLVWWLAMAETLLESCLLGYVIRAFTG